MRFQVTPPPRNVGRVSSRAIMALIVCLSMVIFGGGVANADPSGSMSSWGSQQLTDSLRAVDDHRTDSGAFNMRSANSDSRLSGEFVVEYAAGVRLSGGEVLHAADAEKAAIGQQVQSIRDKMGDNSVELMSSCSGVNAHISASTITYFQLDSCNAAALASLLGAGAGAATVAAAITSWTGVGAAAASVVAGVLAAAGSLTALCNSWGQGVTIWSHPGPFCWSQ